ncbi:unnamed protein product [Ixodes pacificus]
MRRPTTCSHRPHGSESKLTGFTESSFARDSPPLRANSSAPCFFVTVFLFSFAATSTILARILFSTHIRRIALYLRDRVDPGDKDGLPLTFGKRATRCVEECRAVKQWRS